MFASRVSFRIGHFERSLLNVAAEHNFRLCVTNAVDGFALSRADLFRAPLAYIRGILRCPDLAMWSVGKHKQHC